MDFSLSPQQQNVRELTERQGRRFDDGYWLEKHRRAEFPEEFYETRQSIVSKFKDIVCAP